jgi:threonine synthase
VSEEDILGALTELARAGVYAEPTSASAAAAFNRLLATGEVQSHETTALIITGSGLKATQRIGELTGWLA